jgi:hypothetical protein
MGSLGRIASFIGFRDHSFDTDRPAQVNKAAKRAQEVACMILHAHLLARKDLQAAANTGLQRMKRRSGIQSLIELARTDQLFSRLDALI